MEDERLIELVRENCVLYDLAHAKYMDSKYKNNLWNKIGAQLKLNGETCKARWNNIRDNYRKSLKKTVTKSGQKWTNVKLYKYHEQLNFSKKYFIERKRKDSVDLQDKDLELQELEDEEVNQTQNLAPDVSTPTSQIASTPSTSHVPTPSPIYIDSPSANYVLSPSISNVTTPSPSHVSTPSPIHVPTPSPSYVSTPSPLKKKKIVKYDPQKTAASSLMEYDLQKNQASAELTQHPVDAFLNGIAPTLKSLNQYYLHSAKSEIFATVQKYEMKMMTEQSISLLPGVDITNVPAGTVVLQTDCSSQSVSLSNSTAAPVVNSPRDIHNDMSQSISNSNTLANIITDNITQVTYHQHDNAIQNFITDFTDTQ